tara:strand:- start:112 stop:969 length:858 start_codon:yes stop_codon:yes gene_type:complete
MLFTNIDNKNLVTTGLILIIISSLITYNLYNNSHLDERGNSLGLFDTIKNIFGFLPGLPIQIPTKIPNFVKQITYPKVEKTEPEVFNIDNNDYTYEDAKLLCKAYDSELATEEQLIDAHKAGANWCNYGWSANQYALFPTQKSHYDKLQKGDPKNRESCGIPGVNGGVFKNPNLKFGVNCYGVKPKPDPSRIRYLQTNTISEPVLVDKELEKLNEFKEKIKDGSILVKPYQNDKWSKFSFKRSVYNLSRNNQNYKIEEEVDESNKDPQKLESEEQKVSIEETNVL